jgi:beta-lactamase class D
MAVCSLFAWIALAEQPPDIARHFAGIDGTFVLLNGRTGETTRFDAKRAATRFPPCSTFKIPNSAIALETGVAPDVDFVLPYDPKLGLEGNWARDHSLRSAFKYSVVWYYQEMARRAGAAAMARYVHQFGYGNADTSAGVDKFWLGNSLRISADEQVEFLRRLHDGKLGLSERTTRLVREVMVAEETPSWRLSAKTGACRAEAEDVALWYVGFVEKKNGGEPGSVYYFALEMGAHEYSPLWNQRVPKARAILTDLGILK